MLADVAPQLQGLGMPYVAFGVRPTYFDSPAISAPDADWRAATFLTASPDVLLSRVIEPVCGFCWGYRRKEGVTELVDARRGRGEGLARGSRKARHALSRLGVALGLGELKPPPPGVSIRTTSPASRSLVAFDGSSSSLT